MEKKRAGYVIAGPEIRTETGRLVLATITQGKGGEGLVVAPSLSFFSRDGKPPAPAIVARLSEIIQADLIEDGLWPAASDLFRSVSIVSAKGTPLKLTAAPFGSHPDRLAAELTGPDGEPLSFLATYNKETGEAFGRLADPHSAVKLRLAGANGKRVEGLLDWAREAAKEAERKGNADLVASLPPPALPQTGRPLTDGEKLSISRQLDALYEQRRRAEGDPEPSREVALDRETLIEYLQQDLRDGCAHRWEKPVLEYGLNPAGGRQVRRVFLCRFCSIRIEDVASDPS